MMAAEQLTSLRGEMREHEPMSRHTTWRVGGPAQRFYRPADLDDLCALLASLPGDEPVYWVGLGSNLLVRDGGLAGTVVAPVGCLDRIEQSAPGRVYVEAGATCAKVARFCARAGLVGAEFLAGIPGTMGGALAMNAGAFGGETWPLVESVQTVDRAGNLRTRTPAEFEVGYRVVRAPAGEWFAAAVLHLRAGDAEAAARRIRALLEERGTRQPTRQPSAGSVFRNPPGDHAARLIDACGLKGTCIGGACVSEKHANFIVNTGGATADDIETLMTHVARAVAERFGVDLVPEVHVIGEVGND